MKVRYTTGKLTFEIEAEDAKGLFSQLGEVQEVFGEDKCGMCDSTNILFRSRTREGFTFYEAHCRDCNADLKFGQTKEGGVLFPKRKDEAGNYDNKTRGWARFEGSRSGDSTPRRTATSNSGGF